jgi:ATP-dependent DNA ligase
VAPAAPLPQPMLARSGPIPTRGDWSFEVKWDGFRAIVSTEGAPLPVRSRRGWDMTQLLPELSALPIAATFDGELVAFGDDGRPDIPLLCEKMLMRRPSIPVTLMIFDLLTLDGENLTRAPYSERRTHLEALDLNGSTGRHRRRSTTATHYSRPCAGTNSKASSRNDGAAATNQVSAAGSRRRTGRIGATRWSASRRSTSRA